MASNERTRGEQERLAIWQDMLHMYHGPLRTALERITAQPELVTTMPKLELAGLQKRFVGLTTRLQEVGRGE